MKKSRESELGGPGTAANRRVRFQHPHAASGTCEGDGSGEAIRPRADDECVGFHASRCPEFFPKTNEKATKGLSRLQAALERNGFCRIPSGGAVR